MSQTGWEWLTQVLVKGHLFLRPAPLLFLLVRVCLLLLHLCHLLAVWLQVTYHL